LHIKFDGMNISSSKKHNRVSLKTSGVVAAGKKFNLIATPAGTFVDVS
jgi:hypothetical protein